jgi:hypothetical protein
MATLGANIPTLLDVSAMFDKDGKELAVAEVLTQAAPMVRDMPMIESTDFDGHTASVRTGLPTPTWRRYNEGVQPSKGAQATIKFTSGSLEIVSNIDARLAAKYADPNVARGNALRAAMQGMAHEMQRSLFAENEKTNPGRITGFEAFYNSLSAESADNIIDCGGTGSDNTSVWIVSWHPDYVTGFYPRGSRAGIQTTKLDNILIQDGNGLAGATYLGHQDRTAVDFGLALLDWRKVVRLCNIDHSNLVTNSSAADLIKFLSRGVDALDEAPGGKTIIYMRKDVKGVLNEQARASVSTGGGITYEEVDGRKLTMWRGIPIEIVGDNALTKAEARIT